MPDVQPARSLLNRNPAARRGLYHRCRIYATDMNEVVLRKAKAGIFPLGSMQVYAALSQSRRQAVFSEYCTAAYDNAIFCSSLKENIVFSQHNLATDSSFNEFNVILCRNVLIYFNQLLQERVHKLLYEPLYVRCSGTGTSESLKLTLYEKHYQEWKVMSFTEKLVSGV